MNLNKKSKKRKVKESGIMLIESNKVQNKEGEKSNMDFEIDTVGEVDLDKTTKKFSRKKQKVLGYDEFAEQEKDLATDLFGDDADLSEEKVEDDESRMEHSDEEEEVKTENIQNDGTHMIPDDPFDIHGINDKARRKAAWEDEDDDNIREKDVVATLTKARGTRGSREDSNQKYQKVVQSKFSQVIGGTPEWANLDNKETHSDDEDDEMMKTTGNYLSDEKSSVLPKTTINFKNLPAMNKTSRSEGAVLKAVEFNPIFQVGLVAGSTSNGLGAATLFQIDGNENQKIQSFKFPKFPIKCAKFLQDGRHFAVGSNLYGHFFVYDMEAGKQTKIDWNKTQERRSMKNFIISPDGSIMVFIGNSGRMYLFDCKTLSHVETLQAPGEVTAAIFNSQGTRMYTHGDTGEVHIWDMTNRVCVHKFIDDGCIQGTSIDISPNSQYLACGSNSGIVNIYDTADLTKNVPTPVKILDKLVTPISGLKFNATSEILAMASDYKDEAIKLVHFPSMTIFGNFPREHKMIRRVQVMNFSPNSGYFAFGNNGGLAPIYRLKHYKSY